MARSQEETHQLSALALHLSNQREAILQSWRRAIDADPRLTTASKLSRVQLNDHIPEVLDAFERNLSSHECLEKSAATADEREGSAEHGTHRWQQGYDQREVMWEWAHLHVCLLDQLERYEDTHSELSTSVMREARRALTNLCSEGVAESAARYARLQQVEASGRLRDLEQALAQISELERQRALLWREAAHDLRGNLSVVQNAAFGLNKDDVPDVIRATFQEKLQKGVASLHSLLSELTDLARLEAGHEQRNVSQVVVATVLQDLCGNFQELAVQRSLFLKTEGPPHLTVFGDSIKIARIAQNLLVNALMYTERGGVLVSWSLETGSNPDRWTLCIQDTGPGLDSGQVNPIARELQHATEETREIEDKDAADNNEEGTDPAPTLASQSTHQSFRPPSREGIGLSIVKRLCELLDASLELQTSSGEGTTFRVSFPIRY
jgi:signal transduction histidine kinase